MNAQQQRASGATSARSATLATSAKATASVSSPTWTTTPLPTCSLGAHAEGWHRLWLRMPLRHPMLHPHFVQSLLTHWGTGQEHLCWCGPADNPEGVAIVHRSRTGRWVLFQPGQAEVGAALLQHIDDALGLLEALPGHAMVIDLMAIDPAVLAVDFSEERPLEVMPSTHTITVHLNGFEAYWAARPKKLRDNLRRYAAQALAQLGPLDFRWVDAPEAIPTAIDRYAALEAQSWKGREGTALVPGGDQARFYKKVLGQGGGVVAELWAGGLLLASRLMWAAPQGPVVSLKTAYSETHRAVAPGRLLLHWVLHHAHERWPGQRLEFGTDACADLTAWADETRHVRHLSVYRNSAYRALNSAAQAVARTVHPPPAPALQADEGDTPQARVYRSVEALPAPALALLRKAEKRSIQLGADWLACLEHTVFKGLEAPYYFVLMQGQEALAVWPLVGPGAGQGAGVRAMSNYYCAITGPAVQPWCKPQQLLVLVRHMMSGMGVASRLQVFPLDPNDHSTHVLRMALRLAGYGVFGYFGFGNWVHEGRQSWNQFMATLSGNTRSNVRRSVKKLAEGGGRIEIITNPSDVPRGMQAFESVYGKSWKKAEPHPEFFRELAQRLALKGQLRLGVVWLGDVPIATAFWSVAHGVAEIHKLAYDEAHKELSAGTALSAALFERVLEGDGVHKIDYLIGDDSYKQFWMSQRQQRWGLIAHQLVHPMGSLRAAEEGLRRIVRAILNRFKLPDGLNRSDCSQPVSNRIKVRP